MTDKVTRKTNRQMHEEAAGMGLEEAFFRMNGIDPDAYPDTVEVSREELDILRDGFGLMRTAWNTHALYDYQTVQAERIIQKYDALRAQAQPATNETRG